MPGFALLILTILSTFTSSGTLRDSNKLRRPYALNPVDRTMVLRPDPGYEMAAEGFTSSCPQK
jgi:hypothetical protein